MRLAVYLAADGELPTLPIVEYAQHRGCEVFVPVVRRYSKDGRHLRGASALWFVKLAGPMRTNRFGIEEPVRQAQQRIDPRALDAVLVPLVAFGEHGARLGSGAGFYDQTFSFLKRREHWKTPRLIGIGYRFQECRDLALAAWDVALDAVITDGGTHRFDRR